ncbi:PE-PGRS protein, putative [Trichomonas vaginalis G3]|uniref:receptor protein-tyrosine kinase n=1 Tax=Trichomonas vaginalis (strain ATCC PRA-98 / G3) TaxID=412133 RepID=A2EBH7_TRIV3|nr:glycine-rich protein family [Trichomonas vaginalis G3]EAY10007.1 PE-PGRS protein, putative [Trichomonas vaginalis G3]KAI5535078.1 glycine-rich protein family [Trichomonas vaginalis G3]|eukprot:XP_001322230.1 PE-PGRS protein [Trichomonas vaginalis G3]
MLVKVEKEMVTNVPLMDPSRAEVNSIFCYSGGGATDVRLKNSTDIEGLKSRIIVAGAGGGVTLDSYIEDNNNNPTNGTGGHGGNLNGGDGSYSHHGIVSSTYIPATGGSQTRGGKTGISDYENFVNGQDGVFGMGGNSTKDQSSISGGGSGYFGGGGGSVSIDRHGTGAGGSSYVSGCNGCNSVSKYYSVENNNSFIGPVHYSGLSFTSIQMLSGDEKLPLYTSSKIDHYVEYEQGHLGDGAFKITILSRINICSCNIIIYSRFFSLGLIDLLVS